MEFYRINKLLSSLDFTDFIAFYEDISRYIRIAKLERFLISCSIFPPQRPLITGLYNFDKIQDSIYHKEPQK